MEERRSSDQCTSTYIHQVSTLSKGNITMSNCKFCTTIGAQITNLVEWLEYFSKSKRIIIHLVTSWTQFSISWMALTLNTAKERYACSTSCKVLILARIGTMWAHWRHHPVRKALSGPSSKTSNPWAKNSLKESKMALEGTIMTKTTPAWERTRRSLGTIGPCRNSDRNSSYISKGRNISFKVDWLWRH